MPVSEPSQQAEAIMQRLCAILDHDAFSDVQKHEAAIKRLSEAFRAFAAEAVREERERCAAWALDWELRGGDDMETQSGALFHAAEGVECAGRRIGAAILSGEPAPADCVARTRATIRGQDDE